jgi:sigma-B regulation protein RsbU (phosphoserine phosphatase)
MRTLLRQFVLCFCAWALLTICLHAESPSPANFPFDSSQPSASLNGQWRFNPTDNPQFSQPAYDDSSWALLRSDRPWTQQGYKLLKGFAWYRFKLQLPAGESDKGLLLPAISSGYQCFVDGMLIDTEGAVRGQGTARYSMPHLVNLPPETFTHAQIHTVALRVWFNPNLDGSSEAGPDGPSIQLASFGESAILQSRLSDFFALRRQGDTVALALSLLFTLAGIMCVPLFLMEKSNLEYLWYGVAATSYGLLTWTFYDLSTHGWPIAAFLTSYFVLDVGISAGLLLFFSYLLKIKRNWLTSFILFAIVAGNLLDSLEGTGLIVSPLGKYFSAFATCLFASWVIIVVARRASQRVLDARLLVIPVTIDFGVLFLDSLRARFPSFGDPIAALANYYLLTYPFPIQVRDLLAAFVLLAFVLVLLNRFARIRSEHARITADMRAARSIQHLLIPDVLPVIPGLKIEAAYHPAQEVGGDFFQVMPVQSGKTLIVLGDVSGKGLPAAMTVSLVVGVIRTLADFTSSPGAILAGLNTRLVGRGSGFTTCLALEIASDGTLVFANAGQLAPYCNGVEIPSDAALPLGIIAHLAFPESTLQLSKGDRLTLLTDGIPEAASNQELFGFSRTEELSQQSAESIAKAAQLFGQTDDITVLSIEYFGDKL